MRNILVGSLILLFIVIIFEFGYLVISPKSSTYQPVSQTSSLLPSQSNTRSADAGRTKIYPLGSKNTPYSGSGLITTRVEEKLMVFPLPYGKPFYTPVSNIDQYEGPSYQVFHIKADANTMSYIVGYFVRWDTIEGTKDKLLILSDPNNKNKTYEYRVAFEASPLFADNATRFAVEYVNKVQQNIFNPIEEFKSPLASLPIGIINKIIKEGDTIIVTPLFEPPEPNKKDSNGIILASWAIVRRDGGKSVVVNEAGVHID